MRCEHAENENKEKGHARTCAHSDANREVAAAACDAEAPAAPAAHDSAAASTQLSMMQAGSYALGHQRAFKWNNGI